MDAKCDVQFLKQNKFQLSKRKREIKMDSVDLEKVAMLKHLQQSKRTVKKDLKKIEKFGCHLFWDEFRLSSTIL